MKTVQSVLKSLMNKPTKSVLTLLTVGLGVGVLISALSISDVFSDLMERQLEQDGIVVTFANAEFTEEGGLEPVRPPQFDENVVENVRTEVPGVAAVAPLSFSWNQIVAGGDVYRIRNAVASNEQYADVMRLDLIAGSFFTAEDVESGAPKVVLSETTAQILFGSVEASMGKTVQPPMAMGFGGGGGDDRRRRWNIPSYAVVGVYADPTELQRKSYGVGDLVMPYTAVLPQGANIAMARAFFMTTLVMKVRGSKFETVESQLREVLTRHYGADLQLHVWEGTARGESEILKQTRRTVATFYLVVNLLGFVLLLTGSIGILSIMLVEVLGRSREIALERALGASRGVIAREYFARALILSGGSALLGVALSLLLANPLKRLVLPIFSGDLGVADVSGAVISPLPVLIGLLSALVIGGVFGVFPVYSALRTNIAEGIREV